MGFLHKRKFKRKTPAARLQRKTVALKQTATAQKDAVVMQVGYKQNKKAKARKDRFRKKIERALAPKSTIHNYLEYMASPVTIGVPPASYFQAVNLNRSEDTMLNVGTGIQAGITLFKDLLHKLDEQVEVAQGATIDTTPDLRDLIVLESKLNLSLTNPSTFANFVDVYWCVSVATEESNLHATPLSTWLQCLTQNFALGPSLSFYTETTYGDPGATPENAPGWLRYWKILSKERIYLAGGARAELEFDGGSYTYKASKFAGMQSVAGLTKGVMMIGAISPTDGQSSGTALYRYSTNRRYKVMYPVGQDRIPGLATNTSRSIN